MSVVVKPFILHGRLLSVLFCDLQAAARCICIRSLKQTSFSKTNNHALSIELKNRKLFPKICWLSYIVGTKKCYTCVKWNKDTAKFVKINFGARQGSTLLLFFKLFVRMKSFLTCILAQTLLSLCMQMVFYCWLRQWLNCNINSNSVKVGHDLALNGKKSCRHRMRSRCIVTRAKQVTLSGLSF